MAVAGNITAWGVRTLGEVRSTNFPFHSEFEFLFFLVVLFLSFPLFFKVHVVSQSVSQRMHGVFGDV